MGKCPSFLISGFFIETTDMVDNAHPPHLGTYCFKHSLREFILVAERQQDRDKPPRGIFNLYENGQKDLLMVLVSWEKDSGQIVQTVHPLNFVVVYFNLGVWNIFHPCLIHRNSPSFGGG